MELVSYLLNLLLASLLVGMSVSTNISFKAIFFYHTHEKVSYKTKLIIYSQAPITRILTSKEIGGFGNTESLVREKEHRVGRALLTWQSDCASLTMKNLNCNFEKWSKSL